MSFLEALDWIFFVILIAKDTNADAILFFNSMNFSNFNWRFYIFKI